MSSAAKAKIGALYINARKGVKERNILEDNPPLPSKQIIRQRTASSTYVFNQNAQKPWTRITVGCATGASIKNNSNFIGARGH
jgi:hypothetical protein